MKTGRNDPCPCGSGRKFKHCCMLAARVSDDAPADLVWRRMRVLLDGHVADMLRFIEHRYGSMALVEAWDEFTCFEDVEFDPQSPFMQLFMPWFFHCWSPDPEATEVLDQSLHGANPTQVYLASRGRRVDPLLRRYLESLLTEAFSYFEVVSCDPGHGMQLRDIMTSEEHQVTERSASKGVQRGDILFGQLAKVERLTMLEASNCFAISPREKAPIVALRSQIAAAHSPITHEVLRDYDFEMLALFHDIAERAFDPKLPELQNTDGEPLSPRKLIFDLDIPPQTAFDALKHLALDQSDEALLSEATTDPNGNLASVCFPWKKRGNEVHAEWDNTVLGTIVIDGARLTAEVNSEARADAALKAIEVALGDHAQFRVTQIQSMEKLLADARASGGVRSGAAAEEHKRLAESPEVRAKLAEMMAAHFERWVDQPIPALDGRTPLDAVKDADGRDIVESLVIEAERSGRAMNPPIGEAVFQRLRERLGLRVDT
jgi:hypothetical protein